MLSQKNWELQHLKYQMVGLTVSLSDITWCSSDVDQGSGNVETG